MKYKLTNFSINKIGKNSFFLKDERDEYKIDFDFSEINLFVKHYGRGYLRAFDFDRKKKEPIWYLEHCCGLQGFGMDLDDKCYGCNPGKTNDSEIGRFHGKIFFFLDGEPHKKLEKMVEGFERDFKIKEINKNL
jgi:hypothetical protein